MEVMDTPVFNAKCLAMLTKIEPQVEQVFRFMDLPLEVRQMIYPHTIDSRAVLAAHQLPGLSKDNSEYLIRNGPDILNISKTVRAEALQAVVQGTIIDIAEAVDEVLSRRQCIYGNQS